MKDRVVGKSAAIALCVAAGLALFLAGCGGPAGREPGAPARTISNIGSTTVLPLAEKWRAAFKKERPGIEIAVSGGGSGTGIKALISGSADIANSSRDIKEKEVAQAEAVGVDPVEHVVAYDGIAVIVHPSNPLDTVSVEDLSAVFSGHITDWGAMGTPGMNRIQVVSRDSASGTYEAFKELVVALDGKDKSRDYTKAAIGYVGLGYVDDTVKVLAVTPLGGGESVTATVGNIMDGTYAISRALYCYTDGEPGGVVKEYLDWIKGPEGQAIVEELGFVPLKES
jgi:phosphate transport system substrate-binding protein